VYFSRPDSRVFTRSVDGVRRALGRELAREHPAPGADCVFSVPDSSNAMALGYSEASGVKLEHALIRNHYVGRTFIQPLQAGRTAREDQVQSGAGDSRTEGRS
jgi:amidophosphoribosyltransferase